jgi:hypothetical protein
MMRIHADPDPDPQHWLQRSSGFLLVTGVLHPLAFLLLPRKAGGTVQQPEPAAWRLRPGGSQLAEAGRRIHGDLQPAASPTPPRPRQVQDKDKN